MTDRLLFILIVVIPFGGMGLFAVHKAVQAMWFEHFDKRAERRENTGTPYPLALLAVARLIEAGHDPADAAKIVLRPKDQL